MKMAQSYQYYGRYGENERFSDGFFPNLKTSNPYKFVKHISSSGLVTEGWYFWRH
jgi:hypothetical protein